MENFEALFAPKEEIIKKQEMLRTSLHASLEKDIESGKVKIIVYDTFHESDEDVDVKRYYSLASKEGQYIGASLEISYTDSREAYAVITVDNNRVVAENFSKGEKSSSRGSMEPQEKRNITYMRTALALLLDLIERHPEFSSINAYPEEEQRGRAYAILERFGFKASTDDGVLEYVWKRGVE